MEWVETVYWPLRLITDFGTGALVGVLVRLTYENLRVRQAVATIRERQRNFLRGYAAGVFAERSRQA